MTVLDDALATELFTERLFLRVPQIEDGPRIAALIGNWAVVRMLDSVPYPYPENGAEDWLAELHPKVKAGQALVLGLFERDNRDAGLIGCAGVEQEEQHRDISLGFWLGEPYWGRGYMTEAAAALIKHAFAALGLERIVSGHLPENLASAAILRKLGFREFGREERWSKSRKCQIEMILLELARGDFRLPRAA